MKMQSDWHVGDQFAGGLRIIRKADFSQVGHCWMAGRLLEGDLVMAMQLTGDCFWTYCLVEHDFRISATGRPGYKLIPQSAFGAYVLGVPYQVQLSAREFHLLMAGQMTSLEAEK